MNKNNKKIIHVLYSGLGGHANVVFPLLESDFDNEYENVIVFYGVDKVLDAYKTKIQTLGLKYYVITKRPKSYLKPFSEFKTILKKEKPQNIIVHNSELLIPALKYKKNNNCKVYYIEHENFLTKGRLLKFLSKIALKKSNGVVCLNDETKLDLELNFKIKTKINVIPNGINTEFYVKTNLPKSDLIIGMASRMVVGKDHTTLLNAFKIVLKSFPNIKLHIAGSGETLIQTKQLVNDLGIAKSVTFLGLLDEKQMIHFYQSLSIYVQATHSETLSTSILQSMSCALPTIVSDIKNNLPLINENKTGWFYDHQNSIDLSLKLVSCITNFETAIKVGVNAREFIQEHYSSLKMAKNYSTLLNQ